MPDVPGVSADIQRLIHACLALNPEDRPTAEQLALSARQKQFPIKSRKPLYITLVVIALLLVGGLSFFLGGNVVEQTEIPKVPVEEVYQTALHRMDSQNIDSLKSGLRMMDSLSSTNYIPAIYQMAFTYGWYSDSISVHRKQLLGIEIDEQYMPRSDRHSNESDISIHQGLLSFVLNIHAERYPDEPVYPVNVSIVADTLQYELEKVSESRYKCKVWTIGEGTTNIVVQLTEQGCPPAPYSFEVTYVKPAPKTKSKPATKENIVIRRKPKPAPVAKPTPHLEI